MAALDFPSSPTNGQTYTSGTTTWSYNSTKGVWVVLGTGFSGYTGSIGYTGSLGYTGSNGAAIAGGANTNIQFNDSGVSNGTANLTFDKTTNIMKINNVAVPDMITMMTFNLAL